MMRKLAIFGVLGLVALAACDEKLAIFFAPVDGFTPTTGILIVTVRVNGDPRQGAEVQNSGPGGTATATSDASGVARIENRQPGSFTITTTLTGHDCADATGTVVAGETTNVDVTCTQQVLDFVVDLIKSYFHTMPGVESIECGIIITTPPQGGASWTVVPTGPTEGGASGVISGQTLTGTLGNAGQDTFRIRINRFGTYQNVVTVTSQGVTRQVTRSVTVGSAPGTCPLEMPSSQRFKHDIAALLPEGVTWLGLRPVAFRYVEPYGDPGVAQIGLIAEEVVRVYPEAVSLDARGRPEGIYYGALAGQVVEELERRTWHALAARVERWVEALE